MFNEVLVGTQARADGDVAKARGGRGGEQIVSALHGRYYEQAKRGNLFTAYATMTAPVIYTTAGGTGGPLLWNGSTNKDLVVLGVGYAISVVTTVATGLGLTGNSGQPAAPTTTTAIDDGITNLLIGGGASVANAYRLGTVASAGNFFIPFADVNTGALTTASTHLTWVDLGGMIVCPPQSWVSVAAGATASTLQVQVALVWEEVPV